MWVVFIPFAFFIGAFLVGAAILWYLGKKAEISQVETAAGQAIHVDTPVGTLDVTPEAKLDPRLAAIPIYRGAMPENPVGPESVTELRLGWKTFKDISATYWTPDDEDQVWEFYRQQLPDWPRNLSHTQGKELIHREAAYALLVRISRRQDRTIIETSVKPAAYPEMLQ